MSCTGGFDFLALGGSTRARPTPPRTPPRHHVLAVEIVAQQHAKQPDRGYRKAGLKIKSLTSRYRSRSRRRGKKCSGPE